jgi:O-antigen ligase
MMDPTFTSDLIGFTAATLLVVGLVVSLLTPWPVIVGVLLVTVLKGQFGLDLSMELFSRTIEPEDILFTLAFVTALGRMILGRVPPGGALILACVAVFFLAFLRGVTLYGLHEGVLFYRSFYYLSAGLVYGLSFHWFPQRLDLFAKVWIATAMSLILYALAAWIWPSVFQITEDLLTVRDYGQVRVLTSAGALLIADAALIGGIAALRLQSAPFLRFMALVAISTAAMLAHRSVWASVVAAVMGTILLFPRDSGRLGRAAVVTAMIFGVLYVVLQGMFQYNVENVFVDAVSEPFEENSTLNWRITGWRFLWNRIEEDGMGALIWGQGFGTGYERTVGKSEVAYSPHNVYLEIIINAGLVGLAFWLAVHAWIGWALWRRPPQGGDIFDNRVAVALLIAMLVFGLPYAPSIDQGILLGVLAGFASRSGYRRPGSSASTVEIPTVGHQ